MEKIKVSDELSKLYNNSYKQKSKSREINAIGKVNNIIKLSKEIQHSSVLEIGCGEGAILEQLSDNFFADAYYGVEISQSGVNITNSRNIKNLVECKLFNGYSTNYSDKQFDLVILSHVLEHVEHPRLLINEANRIGRVIFIEVPLEDTIWLGYNYSSTAVGHINFYTIKTIRLLIQTSNLNIIKTKLSNQTLVAKKNSSGIKGIFSYYVKQILIKINEKIASKLFIYHYGIICNGK